MNVLSPTANVPFQNTITDARNRNHQGNSPGGCRMYIVVDWGKNEQNKKQEHTT